MPSSLSNSVQNYLRGLKPDSLSEADTETVLELIRIMGPHSGPLPKTDEGRKRAARVFVKMWQKWDAAGQPPNVALHTIYGDDQWWVPSRTYVPIPTPTKN